jgi:hypothetical protein
VFRPLTKLDLPTSWQTISEGGRERVRKFCKETANKTKQTGRINAGGVSENQRPVLIRAVQ